MVVNDLYAKGVRNFWMIHDSFGAPFAQCGEVFILLDGEATFRVDGAEASARGGQVVVAPAGAMHGFRNTGTGTLEMISIHAAAEMVTEWAAG